MIPLRVRPSFWLLSGVLALLLSEGSWPFFMFWVGSIFLSVLIHELGHALAARACGRHPRIELTALGGVTYHDGATLSKAKLLWITANGPIFGAILVFVSAWGSTSVTHPMAAHLLLQVSQINLLWTLLNLMPVLPLDGGQMVRLGLEAWLGFKGIKYALASSTILALGMSVLCFALQAFLAGSIFFLLTFENFLQFRRSAPLVPADQNKQLQQLLLEAQRLMSQGDPTSALASLEKLRSHTHRGLLYTQATELSCGLLETSGQKEEAYQRLLSLEPPLSITASTLLHTLAFEYHNYPLVNSLGAELFQTTPTTEVALRNAYAAAHLNKPDEARGWLIAAHQAGLHNVRAILQDPIFKDVEPL